MALGCGEVPGERALLLHFEDLRVEEVTLSLWHVRYLNLALFYR